ncbi:MAG: hypothetical protein IKR85_09040 [Clostridia bacterium]|nr:hypothetical protein [Clostridia bacterium]
MAFISISEAISKYSYPGAGILAGKSEDSSNILTACFICGRDDESMSRRFVEEGGGVVIEPSGSITRANLIYQPVLAFENKILIGNGTHTEHIFSDLAEGKSFGRAVREQVCLDDGPEYMPRITALIDMAENDFFMDMRLTKAADAEGRGILRNAFKFSELPEGCGALLTMYAPDGDTAFTGEPAAVHIEGSIFDMVADIWENLNPASRVSLWVRQTDMKSHKCISRIINRVR